MSCNGPCIGVGGVCARSDVGGGVEAIVTLLSSVEPVRRGGSGARSGDCEERSRVKADSDEEV